MKRGKIKRSVIWITVALFRGIGAALALALFVAAFYQAWDAIEYLGSGEDRSIMKYSTYMDAVLMLCWSGISTIFFAVMSWRALTYKKKKR